MGAHVEAGGGTANMRTGEAVRAMVCGGVWCGARETAACPLVCGTGRARGLLPWGGRKQARKLFLEPVEQDPQPRFPGVECRAPGVSRWERRVGGECFSRQGQQRLAEVESVSATVCHLKAATPNKWALGCSRRAPCAGVAQAGLGLSVGFAILDVAVCSGPWEEVREPASRE